MTLVRACLLSLAALICLQVPARAELLYALTVDNRLITFDSATPGTLLSDLPILGLAGGESVLGIDYRPATGEFIGVGSTGILHRLDPMTGQGTPISNLSVPAQGNAFGIDFNPTVDRLRMVSDADQNLRINVDTGAAIVDGDLAYATGDPYEGMDPNVAGSAYTNSVRGATTTTLYGIDSSLNTLVRQAPPNAGVLNTVGALGVVTSDLVGFDISGLSGIAYASLTAPNAGFSNLYTINLGTGAATFVGRIGGGMAIRGLAAVPEPTGLALLLSGLIVAGGLMLRRRPRLAAVAA